MPELLPTFSVALVAPPSPFDGSAADRRPHVPAGSLPSVVRENRQFGRVRGLLESAGAYVIPLLTPAARRVFHPAHVESLIVVAPESGELDVSTCALIQRHRALGEHRLVGTIGHRLSELRRAGLDLDPRHASLDLFLHGHPAALVSSEELVLASNEDALEPFVAAFARAARRHASLADTLPPTLRSALAS
ncbi:MAG: hypothetical protein H6724_00740 [Sandaracinus sp.]|nr:hypothetical protein [Myxococcales bacterium]MCB9617956.1 hypothetical protein [Sandaracinus sp.]MCB9622499.1 hypothetical protein [Sandaracinus sp.]MCB9625614.1 hypothetical protein [Sandaracinus sp.]